MNAEQLSRYGLLCDAVKVSPRVILAGKTLTVFIDGSVITFVHRALEVQLTGIDEGSAKPLQ